MGLCWLNFSVTRASSFQTIAFSEKFTFKTKNAPPLASKTAAKLPRTIHPLFFLSLRGGSSDSSTKLTFSSVTFDNGPFWQFNQVMLAANALCFVVSLLSGGSHLHLDLLGTGAFAIASIPTGLSSSVPRVKLSALCVSLWASKLASFLFSRALKTKHDARLSDTLSTTSGTFGFWLISLLWGVLCSLPHSLGATSSYNVPLMESPCSMAGAGLFLLGFLTETTADYQKWMFKKANPGKFCNAGLWSISQHPNFLGNVLLWSGIFLMNAPALIEPPPAIPAADSALAVLCKNVWRFRRLALSALSPLFLYTLFTGQASRTFSNTQELAQKKYGDDPAYQTYMKAVPLIFPNPLKILSGKYK